MTQINTFSKTLRPARFPAVLQCVLSRNYATESEGEIAIPKRIQRSPTDILRALSSTVNRDPTAPHYKYHDDPFLIPASNYAKRSFALAQESGKKAAKWILQEHADLFQHKVADPFIEVFAPKQIITEESDVNVENLNRAISDLAVSDAVTIYQILQKKNVSLSKEVLQSLLELLCFYNAEDKTNEEWIEERWLKQGIKDRARPRKTWKDNGIAETIFLSIDPPDSKSFSALIVGMGLYGQLDSMWKYYDEAKSKGITLCLDAYNVLIKSVGFVREQHDGRWALIKDLLGEMNEKNITPNIKTLNSVLDVLVGMKTNKNTKLYALSVITEFKELGIEPSLASYYYLLLIYCRDSTRKSAILIDIMDALDGKTFTIQDAKDTFFFVTAMEICNTHLSDVVLANRVNSLLLNGKNYNLIGDSYKESVYLRNYFILKCEYDLIDDFMKFYDVYVPNLYVPEPVVMENILKSVDMNGANTYLPRLWSDMVSFDHITRERLIILMAEVLFRNPATNDEELANKLADTAENIFEKIEEQHDETVFNVRKVPVGWTGDMLGNLMGVLLEADRIEKASLILSKLDKEQQKVLGIPDFRPLRMFVDKCIQKKDADKAIWCLQYCYDVGYDEISDLAKSLNDTLKLSDNQLNRLKTLVKLDSANESASNQ
ncbi:small ribosomal subunit protein mS39 [Lycorma delicatula]|uniref:small ribosomal subunit protein mS39 n=1 Tax=Lycorma delicatula TaxID=130591 RepID=UPI003F518526